MKLKKENVHEAAITINALLRGLYAEDVADAVQEGESADSVLYKAACEIIAVLVEAVNRLEAILPESVAAAELIPDEDADDAPGMDHSDQDADTVVHDAALAMLEHVASGDDNDDKAINLLCDIIDAQRVQNQRLCDSLKKALDMLEANGGKEA